MNHNRCPAIVVGGGPAGLFLAARLGLPGTVVLEKGPRPGRKLLASGSGQCNLSHAGRIEEFIGHYGSKGRFLRKALGSFSNEDLVRWLEARGIKIEEETEGGKLFPVSRKASDLLSVLLRECEASGALIENECRARRIERREDRFLVRAERGGSAAVELFESPLVAIATGGKSYPATGSEGDGYALASALGHSIIEPRPALSPIAARDFRLRELSGLSFRDLRFALRRGGRIELRAMGDILITGEGLSGPGILDSSRYIRAGDLIELNFAAVSLEEAKAELSARAAISPRSLVRSVLAESGLPKRLAAALCSEALLDPDLRLAELPKRGREELARLATAYPVEVDLVAGFDKAMATAGGVELGEVDPATMESRIAPGLFFAGEVLDIDGDTGGYNIQAAFSTASLAAKAMRPRAAGLADAAAMVSGEAPR